MYYNKCWGKAFNEILTIFNILVYQMLKTPVHFKVEVDSITFTVCIYVANAFYFIQTKLNNNDNEH